MDGELLWPQPIRLLQPDESHSSLAPNVQAFRLLEQLTKPVAVVSVIGNQRSGKSTLMNLLMRRTPGKTAREGGPQGGPQGLVGQSPAGAPSGFQVGHYLDPQTMGLWAWAKVHPRNPNLVILYLDSEGLDSPHVPIHYNWLLSAVTLLISDVFIYQSKGSIDSHATERLDVILKIVEHISRGDGSAQANAQANAQRDGGVSPAFASGLAAAVGGHDGTKQRRGDFVPRSNASTRSSSASSSGASEDRRYGSQFRPSAQCQPRHTTLFWLLRDHQLQMKQSPRDELLEKLGPKSVQTLEACFREYDCVPLPRPVQSDDLLQKLDTLTWDDLDRSFQDEFTVLERRVLGLLKERKSPLCSGDAGNAGTPGTAAEPRTPSSGGFLPAQKLGWKAVSGTDVAALLKRYLGVVQNRKAAQNSEGSILKDICELPTHSELLAQLAGEKCVKKALEYFGSRVSRDIELPSESFDELVFSMLEEARDVLVQNLLDNGVSNVGEPSDLQKFLTVFDKKVGNTFETKFVPLLAGKGGKAGEASAKKAALMVTPSGPGTPANRTPAKKDASEAGGGADTGTFHVTFHVTFRAVCSWLILRID